MPDDLARVGRKGSATRRATVAAGAAATALAVLLAAASVRAADAGSPTADPDPGARTAAPGPGARTAASDAGARTSAPGPGARTAAPDPGARTAAPGPGAPTSAPDAGARTAAPDAGAGTSTSDAGSSETSPHGHGHEGHGDEMFRPPEDGAVDDPTLPVGTLEVHVVDPAGKPMPATPVSLGVLYNSVAKGESRKKISLTTDGQGVAKIDQLETGSTVAYRPTVPSEGGTFAVMPFRMPEKTGMRAVLHVYPVVTDLASAIVVARSLVHAEVKDDRIQVQQAFTFFNVGRTAWVPKDVVIALPEKFTAFTSQQGMSDVGVDAVPKEGVRLRGTLGPGQHVIEFRWQLPYAGESEVRFDVGMAPRTVQAQIITPASKAMSLDVPGFPAPQSRTDGAGQRSLVTEKQIRKEGSPIPSVELIVRGLPTEGPAKYVATLLAAGILVLGIVLGAKKPGRRDRSAERDRLLAEIEELERAHHEGHVGAKTYERERRELLDAVARTFADDPAPRVKRRRTA